MNATQQRKLLVDALPLLSSYASGEQVELNPWDIGASEDGSQELQRFARELQARQALAAIIDLPPLLGEVEQRPSVNTSLARTETRGAIRGRLDVSRYIATRAANRSLPRPYPVVVRESNFDTPENELVAQSLRELARQLRDHPFPAGTAEHKSARARHRWLHRVLTREPWEELRRSGSHARLVQSTESRLRKRRTGNDYAYGDFLSWLALWKMDFERLGSGGVEQVAEGLLAFPLGDYFWDKIFEIWCLVRIHEVLLQLGYTRSYGPRPLYDRAKGPISEYNTGEQTLKVWYQNGSALPAARWKESGGRRLGGTPDIIISDGVAPLIIDAKYRPVRIGNPKISEEVYKMLGYAENFRAPAEEGGEPVPYHGMLLFPGDGDFLRVLEGPFGGKLSAVVSTPDDHRHLREATADALSEWLIGVAPGTAPGAHPRRQW